MHQQLCTAVPTTIAGLPALEECGAWVLLEGDMHGLRLYIKYLLDVDQHVRTSARGLPSFEDVDIGSSSSALHAGPCRTRRRDRPRSAQCFGEHECASRAVSGQALLRRLCLRQQSSGVVPTARRPCEGPAQSVWRHSPQANIWASSRQKSATSTVQSVGVASGTQLVQDLHSCDCCLGCGLAALQDGLGCSRRSL